jgi:hypothetical protein
VTSISASRERRTKGGKRTPDRASEGWRLPSGRPLFEFALRGGFLAPAILKSAPPAGQGPEKDPGGTQ